MSDFLPILVVVGAVALWSLWKHERNAAAHLAKVEAEDLLAARREGMATAALLVEARMHANCEPDGTYVEARACDWCEDLYAVAQNIREASARMTVEA